MTLRIVKHTVTINQDGFNLCKTIIFQEINTASSEETVENLSQLKDPFHKLWIIIDKTAKIRTFHWVCLADMGEICNHVAAAIYRVKAAVRIALTNAASTSNANEWLPNLKTIELKKIKDIDFGREDLCKRGKKETISSFTKKEVSSTEKR